MSWSPGAEERAALQFDDLASALDAGLPIAALGGNPGDGDRTVHNILGARGVQLSATEAAVLEAGWRAGKIGEALRSRSVQRRLKADFTRRLWSAVRYPLLVLAGVVFASFATIAVVGHVWVAAWVVIGLVAASIGGLCIYRGLRSGGEAWFGLPLVGSLARDLGELPYLETLHALYGAGVPLDRAHHAALQAVPFAAVQRRLLVADAALRDGRKLTEGLSEGLALHAESRSLLTTGELAGQLEPALHNALVRRRAVAAAAAERLARLIGSVLYAGAVIAVVIIVFTFYSRLYSFAR
ncbi:MAG: type II secretion system F family protein [Planctomycetes bacterium]|nr:type II secretion system F family protein [Planctomycetota bacterium]MCB9884934.1 type II secretion system F family protein [Planctomycetota bacterium]